MSMSFCSKPRNASYVIKEGILATVLYEFGMFRSINMALPKLADLNFISPLMV
uniref:Uncharacterized protein n=1 Tax=Rhizophora mucronata TaxID=61149 RepID=A0A2P2NRU0_RHIMU